MSKIFNALLYQPLFNFLILLVWVIPNHAVGWAIIVLTVIIRVLLLPVTIHTARVQVKMRLLQPKIDELKKTHKDDKNIQSQALMALYKEEGVSPFSSCLPLIIQLAVLLVLYRVFTNGLSTAHFDALYSFIPRPESINTQFLGLDLAKPDKLILPIIAGLTQFAQSKVTFVPSTNSDDPMAAVSKQMVYLAPIMTFIFARNFPAALPLYWSVTNIFSVLQQEYVIKRQGLAPAPVIKQGKVIAEPQKATEPVTKKSKNGVSVTIKKRS